MRAADHFRSTATIFGHPLYPILAPFPVTCFTGALVTDIVYSRTENLMWQYFSVWLLLAGLAIGALAVLVGVIDYLGDRSVRTAPSATPRRLLTVVALATALVNAFVHSRDGWTAVVPQGLILSGITVLLMMASGLLGGAPAYRSGLGVAR